MCCSAALQCSLSVLDPQAQTRFDGLPEFHVVGDSKRTDLFPQCARNEDSYGLAYITLRYFFCHNSDASILRSGMSNKCLLVSAKYFSDEKAKTGKILVDANSDRRYAGIMEQDQAIMKTNRDLIGHVKAVLAESTGVDETQSAHLLRCTTCGAPSDGWPDSNPTTHGELCQDCWEAECSESWWRMVNRFPGAAYPVDELESTPES